MPKPKTKSILIKESTIQFNDLMILVDSYSKEIQLKTFPDGTLNRNIKDVLTHIHHWNLMFLDWYKIGMTGEKPAMPAEGYKWKDLPELNKNIWAKYQKHELAKSKKLIKKSFEEILSIANKHSNSELFTKKKYGWTGSTSIGAYIASAIYSHNIWGIKLIKKSLK